MDKNNVEGTNHNIALDSYKNIKIDYHGYCGTKRRIIVAVDSVIDHRLNTVLRWIKLDYSFGR